MSPEDQYNVLQKHTHALMEFFDSVQIIAIKTSDGPECQCITIACGEGPWPTRYGIMKLWLLRMEAKEAKEAQEEDHDEP